MRRYAPPSVDHCPDVVHQVPRAGDDQERGQQPEHHADRHAARVQSRSRQVAGSVSTHMPRRSPRSSRLPASAGPVRRRDRHPRPLQRPPALQVGLPPHREQALRREYEPEPGSQQDNRDQGDDEQREARDSGNRQRIPRRQVRRVRPASRMAVPPPSLIATSVLIAACVPGAVPRAALARLGQPASLLLWARRRPDSVVLTPL